MKALKRFLLVALALCVSAFIGIFAAACDNDAGNESGNQNNQEEEGPKGNGNEGGNGGPNGGPNGGGEETVTGGDSAVKYVTSDADIDAAAKAEYEHSVGTYTYTSQTYNSWAQRENGEGWQTAEISLELDDAGNAVMTISVGGQNTEYSGTYKVYGEGFPPTDYAVIKGLSGEVSDPKGDSTTTATPNQGLYRYFWIDDDGNCILQIDDREGTFTPMVEQENESPDDHEDMRGDVSVSTGEGFVCVNSEWSEAATEGNLAATYTYEYDMVNGNNQTQSFKATVTLSADGTLTVEVEVTNNVMGPNEIAFAGTYKVYTDDNDVQYIIISELKQTTESVMGSVAGAAPSAGFVNWTDNQGNAILEIKADGKCAPIAAPTAE